MTRIWIITLNYKAIAVGEHLCGHRRALKAVLIVFTIQTLIIYEILGMLHRVNDVGHR